MDQLLDEVLNKLCVSKIYWIDDEHASHENLQNEKLLEELAEEIAKNDVSGLSNIINYFNGENQKKLIELNKKWKKSIKDQDEFDPFSQCLATLNGMQITDDFSKCLDNSLKAINGAMSDNHRKLFLEVFKAFEDKFALLSFSDWDDNKESIFSAHNKNDNALILLDQANVREKSSSNGKTVLAEILQAQGVFRILLVSSLTKIDREFQVATELLSEISSNSNIDMPLFAFSKERLSGVNVDVDDEVLQFKQNFVKFLSRFRLSDLSSQLALETKDTLNSAISEAFSKLKRMSLGEFLYAVKHTSDYEGVSELDTLLRMFAIEQRRSLFEKVSRDSKVRDLLGEMSALEVPLENKNQLATDKSLVELRYSEVYEPKETINGLLQPLVPGDIFCCTRINAYGNNEEKQSIKKYILVSNECDLMLRGADGRRKFIGDAILLPINEISDKGSKVSIKLPNPTGRQDNGWTVNIKEICSLPIEVLDLCSYNEEGTAIWHDKYCLLKNKSRLRKSQKLHAENLSKEIFNPKENINSLIYRLQHLATPVVGEDGSVNFGIQRIARLTPELAQMVTHDFSAGIGRPSALHDYSV